MLLALAGASIWQRCHITSASGYWGGLKSDFMFHNIGEAYSEEDAHAFLRLFCAGFGAFHAPLVYYVRAADITAT